MAALLLIRADADASRGLGHLMRCLSLGHAWRAKGGTVAIATTSGVEGAVSELDALEAQSFTIEGSAGSDADAKATRSLAAELHASWIVVDGDQFGPEFLENVKPDAARLLLIDDFGTPRGASADVIVNQNLGASPDLYSKVPNTRLLLGPRYILLRPSFLPWQRWTREVPAIAANVLVFLGGSDPDGTTTRVIQALTEFTTNLSVDVVVGPYAEDPRSGSDPADARFRFHSGVEDMAQLMVKSDLAIVAAGGAMWELLFMQAAVLSFARSPLQHSVVEELDQRGFLVGLGSADAFEPEWLGIEVEELAASPDRRRKLAEAGRDLVDGAGADRVASVMIDLSGNIASDA